MTAFKFCFRVYDISEEQALYCASRGQQRGVTDHLILMFIHPAKTIDQPTILPVGLCGSFTCTCERTTHSDLIWYLFSTDNNCVFFLSSFFFLNSFLKKLPYFCLVGSRATPLHYTLNVYKVEHFTQFCPTYSFNSNSERIQIQTKCQ